jgi:hypothetical protein
MNHHIVLLVDQRAEHFVDRGQNVLHDLHVPCGLDFLNQYFRLGLRLGLVSQQTHLLEGLGHIMDVAYVAEDELAIFVVFIFVPATLKTVRIRI